MQLLKLTFILLIGSLCALAADISGTWNFSVDTPNGKRESTVEFKQDGEKLSGTMKGQAGDSPLTGTVNGMDVTFSITRDFGGQSMKIDYTAKLDGNKMSGTLNFGGQGEAPFTAEKK